MGEHNQPERTPPQPVKSEAAILGAILRDNNLQRVAAGRLEASSFYIRNNGKLWGILPDLIAQAGGRVWTRANWRRCTGAAGCLASRKTTRMRSGLGYWTCRGTVGRGRWLNTLRRWRRRIDVGDRESGQARRRVPQGPAMRTAISSWMKWQDVRHADVV